MAFWRSNQAWITPILLLLLPVGLFLVMIVIPVAQSIWTSFYDWDGTGPATWVGLSNYIELFGDSQFYTSLRNNIIWFLMFLLAPVFGLALALFLNQPLPELRFVKSVFFLPLVLAHVIIGVVFTWFYDPTFGIMAILFRSFGLEPIAILSDEHFVTFGIIAAALWAQIAFCLVLFLAGLSQLDLRADCGGSAGRGFGLEVAALYRAASTAVGIVRSNHNHRNRFTS